MDQSINRQLLESKLEIIELRAKIDEEIARREQAEASAANVKVSLKNRFYL